MFICDAMSAAFVRVDFSIRTSSYGFIGGFRSGNWTSEAGFRRIPILPPAGSPVAMLLCLPGAAHALLSARVPSEDSAVAHTFPEASEAFC